MNVEKHYLPLPTLNSAFKKLRHWASSLVMLFRVFYCCAECRQTQCYTEYSVKSN
jgi:hypothetical protein